MIYPPITLFYAISELKLLVTRSAKQYLKVSMSGIMNVPVFIDITYEEQAEELRAYLKSLGGDISAERSEQGLEDDLAKIIAVCDLSFTASEATEADVEGFMNGIVSMLALCSGDKSESLILAFCDKLSTAPNTEMGLVAMKVLWTLYQVHKQHFRHQTFKHLQH